MDSHSYVTQPFVTTHAVGCPRKRLPPNKRMKLAACDGRLMGNWSVLFAAVAGRSLCAIR